MNGYASRVSIFNHNLSTGTLMPSNIKELKLYVRAVATNDENQLYGYDMDEKEWISFGCDGAPGSLSQAYADYFTTPKLKLQQQTNAMEEELQTLYIRESANKRKLEEELEDLHLSDMSSNTNKRKREAKVGDDDDW